MKRWISAAFTAAALASTPALAGPDFVSSSPQGTSLAASAGSRSLTPQDDVLFAHDSAALDDVAHDQLAQVARWLRQHPRHRVVIEGYADPLGAALYNEDLATRRAQSVRWHLLKHGIASDRVVLLVYGETLADPGKLERRVVIYATELSPRQIARASIDHKYALSAMWTDRGALFTEARGRAIATR